MELIQNWDNQNSTPRAFKWGITCPNWTTRTTEPWFGVPHWLIGDKNLASLSSVKSQTLYFYTNLFTSKVIGYHIGLPCYHLSWQTPNLVELMVSAIKQPPILGVNYSTVLGKWTLRLIGIWIQYLDEYISQILNPLIRWCGKLSYPLAYSGASYLCNIKNRHNSAIASLLCILWNWNWCP